MYRGLFCRWRTHVNYFNDPYVCEVCITLGKRPKSACSFSSFKGISNDSFEQSSRIDLNSDYLVASGKCQNNDLRDRRYAQIQIVDALRFGEREKASRLLDTLVNETNYLRADDFYVILGYCARSPDPLFVMETMKAMEVRGVVLNKTCYSFLTQALAEGGYLKEAFDWLASLSQEYSTAPDLPMYNSYLNACATFKSPIGADHCLRLMEDRSLGKSEVTYWELLKLAVWQQNLYAVHEMWKVCMDFYNPTILCLRKFIWCFSRLGDLESAYNALQQMVSVASKNRSLVKISPRGRFQSSNLDIPIPLQKELRPNTTSEGYSTKNAKNIKSHDGVDSLVDVMMERQIEGLGSEFKIFQGHLSSGGKQKIPRGSGQTKEKRGGFSSSVDQCMQAPAMKILRWSFSDVLHACAHLQNHSLAEILFQQMQSFGLTPTQHTYDGLVKAVVRANGVRYGLDVIRDIRTRNLTPYNATLATLSLGCCKIFDLDLAESLLDQINEGLSKYAYSFNALLYACDVMDDPERAMRVLAKMRRLNLNLDVSTYALLFSLFGTVNAPYEYGNMISQAHAKKRILAVEKDMVDHGVLHNRTSFENLLRALGAEGMINELVLYLKLAERMFSQNDRINMYNIALHALVEVKEGQRALKIFKNIKLCGLPPNATTYNIMIDCCSTVRWFKSAFAFVSLMLREGFAADAKIYTALLKMVVSFEDFDHALFLLDEALSGGVQPDVLMFNTVIEKASYKWRIDVIEYLIKRMHQENIQPDPSTCTQTFYAYIKQGFISTGIEALQVLSLRMISLDESYLAAQNSNLEAIVLCEEDLEFESRIADIFTKSSDQIAVALLNLRWCAMCGFSICWTPRRSMWAKSLNIC